MHVDLVALLPPSGGFTYLLTYVDRFLRWSKAIPLPNCTVESAAKALLERWVATNGWPVTLTTDKGSHFEEAFKGSTQYTGLHSRLDRTRVGQTVPS
ncbi:unnamed protein product [Echinostoma caproni]|uniref:Integrase catalytic domain-containing protein n=1 Tax=Echinostoma caproni TaxID=27848 RepID=A0A183B5F9_9TREM|nr:unnamed protein product [Echinostoma caproni]